jgi:hypothetical protein
MSNTHAIAAVTATLRYVLSEAISREPDPVPNRNVTTLRPAQIADLAATDGPARGLNVYCYQVTPNHAWNLHDLPTRGPSGSLTKRPLAALDLHYLITAYGSEDALEPQRLLAQAALALTNTPVLSKDVVEAAIEAYDTGPTAFLARADLAGQPEPVKLSPAPLSLEEISKLWGVLGTPYLLSQAYVATVVLIEADLPARSPLPVRTRNLQVAPFTRAEIASVATQDGEPATAGSTIVVDGSGLTSVRTYVAVGGRRLAPAAGSTSARVVVDLPDSQVADPSSGEVGSVPAGVQRLQVVHVRPADPASGAPERVTGRSNAVPLVVVPTVSDLSAAGSQVELSVTPAIVEGQRVVVTFGRLPEAGDPPGTTPRVVAATLPPWPPQAPPTTGDPSRTELEVDLDEPLPAGTWLVRVGVDGVESVPVLGAGGTYDAPTVTLP